MRAYDDSGLTLLVTPRAGALPPRLLVVDDANGHEGIDTKFGSPFADCCPERLDTHFAML